jgi:hypothetical protein
VTPGALVRVVVELDPRSWRDPGRADAAVRGSAASPLPQDDRAGLGTQ